MRFDKVNLGSYYIDNMNGKTYRKVSKTQAIDTTNDVLTNVAPARMCEPTEKPKTPLNLIVQYLDWAMIQALSQIHPDCYEVTTVYDLDRKQAHSSFKQRDQHKSRVHTVE